MNYCLCCSIDGRGNTGFARLVNDGTGQIINCTMKIVVYNMAPHLCLFATRSIARDEELRYDYGGFNCPWRNKCMLTYMYHIKCIFL